jgi:phosphoribosylanthranilate isomerase
MNAVKVKICGITRDDDLQTAIALGADALGFVVGVPASPRNLAPQQATRLIDHVPLFVASVVVLVPQSVDDVVHTCESLRPTAVQLHGGVPIDPAQLRRALPTVSVIRAITVSSDRLPDGAADAAIGVDAVLLDSFAQGLLGGTGVVHDWTVSKRVKQTIHPTPLILAGGLTPDNVREAIHVVQPYAVDVSTGVESRPGRKDPVKVSAFIQRVKEVMAYDP